MAKQLGNFSFKLVNTDADNDKLIVLLPGSFPVIGLSGADWASKVFHYHDLTTIKAAGYSNVDGVLDDNIADVAGTVTCTPSDAEFGIQHFLQHIRTNPYKIHEIMLQADNEDVFNEKLIIQRDNPTIGTSKRFIKFTDYFKPSQFQNLKIIIPEPNIFLSDETFMMLNIPAARTLTIHYNRLEKL